MLREANERSSDEVWSNYGAVFRHGLELLTPETVDRVEGWLDGVSAKVPSSQPPTFLFDAEKLTEKGATFSNLLWHLSWFEHVYVDKKGLPEAKFLLPVLGQEWKFILSSSRDTLYAPCVECDNVFPESGWESHLESHRGKDGKREDLNSHHIFPPNSRFWDQQPRKPRSNQSRHYSFEYEWQWEDNTELPSYAPILASFSQHTPTKQKNIAGCVSALLNSKDLWYGPTERVDRDPPKILKLGGEKISMELTRNILNFILITHTCECAPISLQHAELLRIHPEPHCDLVLLYELLRQMRESTSKKDETDTRMTGRVMGSEHILQQCLQAFHANNQPGSLGEFLEKNYPLLRRNVGLREGRESMSWGGVHFDRLVKVLDAKARRPIETTDPVSLVRDNLKRFYKFHLSEVKVFPGPVSMDIDDIFVTPDYRYSQSVGDGKIPNLNFGLHGLAWQKKVILLRGDPASGKTVTMKQIAISWAKRVIEPEFDLVFFVELSRVADLKSSSCLALAMHYLAKQFDRGLGDDALREALISKLCEEKSKLLFLFDGLDEGALKLAGTPEGLHGQFTADLPKEISDNCCFLISSRSYSRFLERQEKFPMTTLLGFTKLDQRLHFFRKKIEQADESIFHRRKPQKSSENNSLERLWNFIAESVLPQQKHDNPLFSFPLLLSFIYTISEDRIVRRNQSSEEELAALKEELTSSKTELYYKVLEMFKVRYFEKFNSTFQALPKFEMDNGSKNRKSYLEKANKNENAQTDVKPWFKESYLESVKRLALRKLLKKKGAESLQLSGNELIEIDRKCVEIGYLMEEETLKTRCLLFHHKSVQEFFAALYFAERSTEAVAFTPLTLFEKFYVVNELENFSEVILFILGLYGVTEKWSVFPKNEGFDFILKRILALEEKMKVHPFKVTLTTQLLKSCEKPTPYEVHFKERVEKYRELRSMFGAIFETVRTELRLFRRIQESSTEKIVRCLPKQRASLQFVHSTPQSFFICFQYLDEVIIMGTPLFFMYLSFMEALTTAVIYEDEFMTLMKEYGECQGKRERLRLYNLDFKFTPEKVLEEIPKVKCLSFARCYLERDWYYMIPNHVESIELGGPDWLLKEVEKSIVKNTHNKNLLALLERTTFLFLTVNNQATERSRRDIIQWLLSKMPQHTSLLLH